MSTPAPIAVPPVASASGGGVAGAGSAALPAQQQQMHPPTDAPPTVNPSAGLAAATAAVLALGKADSQQGSGNAAPAAKGGRLLIVANRLPFTIALKKKPVVAQPSATGSATAQPAASGTSGAVAAPAATAAAPAATAPKPLFSAGPSPAPNSQPPTPNAFAAALSAVTQQKQQPQQQPQQQPNASEKPSAPLPPPAGGVSKNAAKKAAKAAAKKAASAAGAQGGAFETEVSVSPSPGGLVSALRGVESEMEWVGWPGLSGLGRKEQRTVRDALASQNCSPVFIDRDLFNLFYNGYSNDTLWPLFHYIPLSAESLINTEAQFDAYMRANVAFAKVVLQRYKEGDTVWVHDYQLMLLPAMLRAIRPSMKIGFFLHIPFPSSEIFRVLPARRQLLLGVLAADLIGFHTHDYTRHFQSACSRILGASCVADVVRLSADRNGVGGNGVGASLRCALGTFPIGIDPHRFLRALETPAVGQLVRELRNKFGERKVLLGVDRLDYIKGILHKLFAFERFLATYPEWIGRVVLVQIAVPSRTDVVEYQKLRDKAHEVVGRINGKYGGVQGPGSWGAAWNVPCHYLDTSLSFDHMVSLYRYADALVVSSIRDGMNLVAYEYVACQQARHGVLILSEFAGAAQSLGAGALQVNPWSYAEMAGAMHQALTMSAADKAERFSYVFRHVMAHTATAWSKDFLRALEEATSRDHHHAGEAGFPVGSGEMVLGHALQGGVSHSGGGGGGGLLSEVVPPVLPVEAVVRQFAQAKRRLVVLGLAGTLSSDKKWTTFPGPNPNAGANNGGAAATSASAAAPSAQSSLQAPSTSTMPPASPLDGLGDFQFPLHHPPESGVGGISPALPTPVGSSFTAEMESIISILARDPLTTLVVVSSRSRAVLDELLGRHPSLWLSAENGFFLRPGRRVIHRPTGAGALGNIVAIEASPISQQGGSGSITSSAAATATAGGGGSTSPQSSMSRQASSSSLASDVSSLASSGVFGVGVTVPSLPWQNLHPGVDLSWKEGVARVYHYFTERTPRSFVADAETHLSWSYRASDPQVARRQVNDLIAHLMGGPLSNTATEVLDSSAIVQVRPLGISKATALKAVLHALLRRERRMAARRRRATRRKSLRQEALDVANAGHSDSYGNIHALAQQHAQLHASSPRRSTLQDTPAALDLSTASGLDDADWAAGSIGGGGGDEYDTEFDDDFSLLPAGIGSPHPTASGAGHHHHHHAGESIEELLGGIGLDFVLVLGNFLARDEDVFSLLNPVAINPANALIPSTATAGNVANAAGKVASGVSGSTTPSAQRRGIRGPTVGRVHSPAVSSPQLGGASQQSPPDALTLSASSSTATGSSARPPHVNVSREAQASSSVPSATTETTQVVAPQPQSAATTTMNAAESNVFSPPGVGAAVQALTQQQQQQQAVQTPASTSTALSTTAAQSHGPVATATAAARAPRSMLADLLFGSAAAHLYEQLAAFQLSQAASSSGGPNDSGMAEGDADAAGSAFTGPSPSADEDDWVQAAFSSRVPSVASPSVITCSVGRKVTRALFHLPDRRAVAELLQRVSQVVLQEEETRANAAPTGFGRAGSSFHSRRESHDSADFNMSGASPSPSDAAHQQQHRDHHPTLAPLMEAGGARTASDHHGC